MSALVKTSQATAMQLAPRMPDIAEAAKAQAECARLAARLAGWRGPGVCAVQTAVRKLSCELELFEENQRRQAAEALRQLPLHGVER